ncbi:hypothetical protein PPERSA_12113 [Pseudocohnilembus persalinus]|uniref:Uncharacterized protein n=1 Tax=Pseudocohnilembus persalinus TaxID=266149 RepID=A0A0V0QNZ8_PSEPJ|nr:hypothetical protein PPERSA_12113 [Pseudocohnilembus persalinus]|eukprot:KRX03908.1 hypothetical protein PPERSA_12113 [Pseudocohnilembus persalinus]
MSIISFVYSVLAFSFHELILILLFLTQVVPKLLKIWGNIKQSRIIINEELQKVKGDAKTPKFYLFLVIRVVGDVFFTDRSQLLLNRKIDRIDKNVQELLKKLEDKKNI